MTEALPLLRFLLAQRNEDTPFEAVVRSVLDRTLAIHGGESAELVIAEGGTWRSLRQQSHDEFELPPLALLGHAADDWQARSEGEWHLWPLAHVRPRPTLLVVRGETAIPDAAVDALDVALHGWQDWHVARRQATLATAVAERWSAIGDGTPISRVDAVKHLRPLAAAAADAWHAQYAMFFFGSPNAAPIGVSSETHADPAWRHCLPWIQEVVQSGQPQLWQRPGRTAAGSPTHPLEAFASVMAVPLFGETPQSDVWAALAVVDRPSGFRVAMGQEALDWSASLAQLAQRLGSPLLDQPPPVNFNEAARLIGSSPQISSVRDQLRRVADTDVTVLILGENGTGKEVASRSIHELSDRKAQPFVAINCAAISNELLVSELFGHEKGAFTDAHETRQGKFELAEGGTLFLDEIGELTLTCQAQLLRALEEKIIVRLGGSEPIAVEARILAATNRDLSAQVRRGDFREDLFFRLNVVQIELPPLRARIEDLDALADHFLHVFCNKAKRPTPKISDAALARLRAYAWPGNVRELRNTMERVAYLVARDTIGPEDLPPLADDHVVEHPRSLLEATRQFQIDYIDRQIQLAAGNITQAAERLGMHRSNLYRKMHQLGMDDGNDAESP